MTTSAWALIQEKKAELPAALRRAFWLPLRRVLKMFHLLPVVAAFLLFGLLATDGQLREIYVSYLEDVGSGGFVLTVIRFAAAAAGFALISAVLYEAHYRLSGPRINVIYSMNSEVGTSSRLRHVQDVSAIVIALSPWLGLVGGLLHAKGYLAGLFETLRDAGVNPALIQHVPMPSAPAIAAAVMFLGLVMAWLAAANPKDQALQRAIMILTPPAAALLFLLLAGMPEGPITTFEILAIAATIATVVVYYVVYYRIRIMRAYIFYAKALQEDDNLGLRQWQRIVLFGWAALPWLVVLALYFLSPWIAGLAAPGDTASAAQHKSLMPDLAMIGVAISWVVGAGLIVASSLRHIRDRAELKLWLYVIISALAAIGLLLFGAASSDSIVTVYRLVGPLGTLALSLLFLTSVFAVLAVLSQRSNFPAMTLAIFVLVASAILPMSPGWSTLLIAAICFAIVIMAVLARLLPAAAVAMVLIAIVLINYMKAEDSALDLHSATPLTDLKQQFTVWLDNRGVPPAGAGPGLARDRCFARSRDPSGQYPVYIVAVEGGGIYAASAASMFLARLQDEDSCFADHVFAISAVSGGAIGATIFQAVELARLQSLLAGKLEPSDTCLPPPPQGNLPIGNFSLERRMCRIIQDDHFSPLIAAIFPELLGFRTGRAPELEASFLDSVYAHDHGAAGILSAPFSSHWSAANKVPALVLNATWVETGFRTVFAPFPLHAIDDSLYSFVDQNMPINSKQTLLEAALVSARFPFVLPPYSMRVNAPPSQQSGGKTSEAVRWNFVDGGYSDSSGAATALALYKALYRTARARHIALRVVLLTSSDPKLEPNQINGTAFADIMGPVDAILSVRAGLANEAVARACDGVFNNSESTLSTAENTCEERASRPDSPLQIVGIEDQTYGLSLGWKISQTTFSVVSWMLGQPHDCDEIRSDTGTQSNDKFILTEKIVKRNSCVLHYIKSALGGVSPDSKMPNAAPSTQ
jgi:hypothetical protein